MTAQPRAGVLSRRALLRGGLASGVAFPDDRGVTLGDSQGWTKGPFTAFMAPYNKGALRAGADYTESIRLDPATFPAGTRIEWDWPAARARDPVRGFLAIDYGDYYNTVPEAPVPSARAAGIGSLACAHDLSIGGEAQGFAVIVNFFLTASPDPNSILFEIEVFLHAPAYAAAYLDGLPSLGAFRSASGLAWRVCRERAAPHGPDLLFRRADGAGLLAGEVDLREMLAWLAERGQITGGEFFNGLALGVEPRERRGTLDVRALSVRYAP